MVGRCLLVAHDRVRRREIDMEACGGTMKLRIEHLQRFGKYGDGSGLLPPPPVRAEPVELGTARSIVVQGTRRQRTASIVLLVLPVVDAQSWQGGHE